MHELGHYCATRLATPRVIALAALVSGLAIVASRAITGAMLAQSVALAILLIAQFRLLDDLADLEHDRRHHPERVLCRVQTTKAFIYALVVLGLGICALLLLGANALKLTVYALLLISFVVLYANLRENSNRLLRAHVVLIKYPVFLYLCMYAPVDLSWALLAAVLYYALCVWEIIDDAALRRHKGATAMLVIDTLLLVITLILFIVHSLGKMRLP